jgi:hypothetical protein
VSVIEEEGIVVGEVFLDVDYGEVADALGD